MYICMYVHLLKRIYETFLVMNAGTIMPVQSSLNIICFIRINRDFVAG